jgi:hypothetical protein
MECAVGNPNDEVVIGNTEDGRNDGLELEVLVGAPPSGVDHKVLHFVIGFHGAAFEEKGGGGDVHEIVADVYALSVRDGIVLHIFISSWKSAIYRHGGGGFIIMLQISLKVNRGMKKRPVYGGPLGWRNG